MAMKCPLCGDVHNPDADCDVRAFGPPCTCNWITTGSDARVMQGRDDNRVAHGSDSAWWKSVTEKAVTLAKQVQWRVARPES